MRGLDGNDRLPAIAADGELQLAAIPEQSARGGLREPQLAPLLSALGAAPGGAAGPLWVAVPSRLAPASMAVWLRELRAAGSQVQGFVDAAVAACAWIALDATAVVLDMGAHGTAFSVVTREADTWRLRRSAVLPMGAADLHDAWVRLLAASMVKQTRFDPLHDPALERSLRSRLPAWLADADRDGVANIDLPVAGASLQVAVSRDQFATTALEPLRAMGETLQGLCAALGDCQVLAPADIAHWPGVTDMLQLAGSRPVSLLSPGTSARAASLLPPSAGLDAGVVQYLTQLAHIPPAAPPDACAPFGRSTGVAQAPTHLIHRGRAVAIDAAGLVLGRDPGVDAAALPLPEGIAGLSRRHCTLRRMGGEVVIIDHSRHGSFVDGQRVSGRALLRAGSVLRLGTPGIELQLVAVDAA